MTIKKTLKLAFALCSISLILAGAASAQKSKDKGKYIRSAVKTSKDATDTLNEIMRISDRSIPQDLLDKAEAVAVFPNVFKAAFIIGGNGGKGLISRRVQGGWSAPALFKLGGGSLGFQIGASSTDYIMLFMTDDSLKKLLQDKVELGGEISVAGGPVGRTAKATTDAQLQAGILSYSRSKGLFAGVSLTGAVISPDNDVNQALYSINAKELLTGANKVVAKDIPPATKNFEQALTRFSH